MPSGRRVVLHMGMGKTGSTALQVAFVRNRALMSACDVDYPLADTDDVAAQDGVTSGNGMGLAHALVPWLESPDQTGQTDQDGLLEALASTDARTTLYSSEFLYHFDEQRLRALLEHCRAADVSLEAVVYVRDVAGHALSSYLQDLQRARCTVAFTAFVEAGQGQRYDPQLERRVGFLRDALGSGLQLIRYDAVRDELVPDFFEEVLDIPRAVLRDPVSRRINRSLTSSEAILMRAVNERLATASEGKAAGDALLTLVPFETDEWSLTPDELATLTDRFGGSVDWLNTIGVRGGPLQVLGGLRVGPRERERALDPVHGRLLDWLAASVRGA